MELYYVGIAGGAIAAHGIAGGDLYEESGVGVVGVTQADDTVVATGAIAIKGTLAATQASDTASSSGEIEIAAASGATQAGDTLSATATLKLVGSVALGQDDNEIAFTGAVALVGEATLTQDDNTSEGSFVVGTFGFLAQQYRFAGIASYGIGSRGIAGEFVEDRPGAIIQQSDQIEATGTVLISGAADLTQDDDTVAATGSVLISATMAATQADDTMSAAAEIRARIRLRGASVGGGAKGGVSTVGGGSKMRLAA